MKMSAQLVFGLAIPILATAASPAAQAQGLVRGVEQGARQGRKAAGPVGGVLGGAIGGVVGVVSGVLGGPGNNQTTTAPAAPQASSVATPARPVRTGKSDKSKLRKQVARPVQQPAPLSPETIVAASDANIARLKTELNLTSDQQKHWTGFNSAMHYLGHNGADRLNLRVARARRDPPDDIVEQMRNEAQFLNDRAVDQRNVADAAEPLFASLDDKQKAIFIMEMVRLSRERGLD